MIRYEKRADDGRHRTTLAGLVGIVAIFIVLPLTLAFACIPRADAQKGASLNGVARVKDGDTFYLGTLEIRLHGFDTPEEGKKCGTVKVYEEANAAMRAFADKKQVACIDTGRRNNGRIVADCTVGGVDFGSHMVAQGWARDWPQFSGGKYCALERQARTAKRGLWGMACTTKLWGSRRDYTDPKTGKAC